MSGLLRTAAVVLALTVAGCSSTEAAEQAAAPSRPSPTPATSKPATATPAAPVSRAAPATTPPATPAPAARTRPLRSVTIALDPGHQLGNSRFPRQTNALVPAGGFSKPCNTTGAATDAGVAEATVNFRVARAVKRRLTRLGARVLMTRTTNSQRLWGPCVDARGRFGEQVGARLTVSLHADGAPASARGFHVIAPEKRAPWTTDIADASLRLATALRNGLTSSGIPRSTYIGGGTALDVRGDLGTLNLSDVPVAMIEMGNLRNASDATRMTTHAGQGRYARAVVRGIRAFLGR